MRSDPEGNSRSSPRSLSCSLNLAPSGAQRSSRAARPQASASRCGWLRVRRRSFRRSSSRRTDGFRLLRGLGGGGVGGIPKA